MDGAAIISLFKNIVDDESISDEFGLNLADTAKDEIEEERGWRMLLIGNTDNTFNSGDNYQTEFDLPTDFNLEHKVALVDSNDNEDGYDPIPFEDLIKNKDVKYYSIDHASDKFYILGTVAETKTIHFYYFKFTPGLALDSKPVWPTRFHKLIAYRMAEIYLRGVDADSLTRLQWPAHKEVADRGFRNMKRWDSRLWMKTMNNRAGFESEGQGHRTGVISELAD